MKFPLSWLKELVDFEDTIEGLSDKLTFAGLEVENIETIGGTFEGVVVGEIKAIEPHPNADKLRLCTVEYGADETMRVVCGAPNVEVDGKYPFAPVGTTLPGGFTLKKAKIRGEVSMGMLCAKDELGLGNDHAGLMVLNADLAPGTPFANLMPPPETVFELEITPNRPDCLSIIGIAREVAAIYGAELRMPSIELKESTETAESLISVDIQDAERCPRYTARVLKNAKVGPSPDWMVARLEACGIRAISNLVDITNYVMLETGHPLHAFDYHLVKDGKIIVRRAEAGETFTTLDDEERELTDEMLVIADPEKAVALAGVMGGANTEIKDDTSTVLLEAATFEQSGIRHTAKALGHFTDSSYRFQRGVNADTVEWASRRAAALMAELAEADLCAGVVDAYPAPKTKNQVSVKWANICKLIGLDVPVDEMKKIFQTLEMVILSSDDEGATLEIPTFRDDLVREVDMIEEVARMYGVDKIPEKLPTAQVVAGAHDDRVRAITACRKNLAGLGAREIMNYTLVNHPLLDLFGKSDDREELPHPISAEQSVLRTSLIPQMVESLGRNKSRQINNAVFFEIGRTFSKGAQQTEKVCLGVMGTPGRAALDSMRAVSEEEIFLWLKGLTEQLLIAQKVTKVKFQPLEKHGAFEEGRALKVMNGKTEIGVIGLINSNARKEWRLNDPVAAAELNLDPLISNIWKTGTVQDIPLYPATERDFAFIVDEAVRHEEIIKAINGGAPAELEKVELFDIFRGKSLEKGKKSMAYSFVYRSPKGTLTDDKVNKFHEAAGQRVCKATGAAIRES
ncbi:phenylalanine--tRNA ligase subunit beta [Tichowtungia aerotolerans]|uniref:Phenylalanine--tRNA ligase beta subunit n=1 Tax=Tichowtungia aerotolerans TaxID=2697043 RepID=A0A6P1M6M9_9BACT|nr:phenylalanine--tRNA ligase subunit beta [Tichowtungia aerotolerans]QHI69511.1 phenylalanine--tRNA ligase subunit beta [Tichowtungia aerotolerans]